MRTTPTGTREAARGRARAREGARAGGTRRAASGDPRAQHEVDDTGHRGYRDAGEGRKLHDAGPRGERDDVPDRIGDQRTHDEQRDGDDDATRGALPDRRGRQRETGAAEEPYERTLAPIAADGENDRRNQIRDERGRPAQQRGKTDHEPAARAEVMQ